MKAVFFGKCPDISTFLLTETNPFANLSMVRLSEYLKGLEYEPTVKRFWERHWEQIQIRERQYRDEVNGILGSSGITEFAIIEYLSTFEQQFYQGNIKLLIRAAVLGFLVSNGKKIAKVKGTPKEFMECNSGILTQLYRQFQDIYHLADTPTLKTMFRYGTEDYIRLWGLLPG